MLPTHPLIAFAGYAGCGKDTAAAALIERGYKRRCFGDIIKRQIGPLIWQHCRFSAFTEIRAEKEQIRRTLEAWGEDNYDGIIHEFFRDIEPPVVNTRLVRAREAHEWRRRGGVVWRINRWGCDGATDWERDRLGELYAAGLIDDEIDNNSTPEVLQWEVLRRARMLVWN